MISVYRITNLVTGKNYIGICASKVRRRWRRHCNSAAVNKPRNRNCPALHGAIRKYGEAAFSIETLYEAVDWLEACKVERGLIAQYGTLAPNGYNLTSGGEGRLGCKFTEAEHRRRSEWAKAHPPSPAQRAKMTAGAKGRRASPETIEKLRRVATAAMADPARRAKQSALMRARTLTEETREKMRLSQKGRKHSPETKAKMSAWQMGRKFSAETRARISAALKSHNAKRRSQADSENVQS